MGLGCLLAVVAFYIISSSREIIQGPLLSDLISGEGLMLRDIHYTHNDPGEKIKWVLDARKVKFSGDKRRIFFQDFRLEVEPENRPWYTLKGKKGDYFRDSGEINLWGDLEGLSSNGYRILTEHILINEKSGYLRTDERVKIFGPFFSVEGQGLFVDLEGERLKIMSNVTATVKKEPLT